MKRLLFVILSVFSCYSCQKENHYIDGGTRYDFIYLHTGGALIKAHNSVLMCPQEANTVSLEIVSLVGLTKVELMDGEEYASIKASPSFPPDEGEIYEVVDNIYDRYIQKITLFFDINITSQHGRKAVLRVESPAYGSCVAEITIIQEGW